MVASGSERERRLASAEPRQFLRWETPPEWRQVPGRCLATRAGWLGSPEKKGTNQGQHS